MEVDSLIFSKSGVTKIELAKFYNRIIKEFDEHDELSRDTLCDIVSNNNYDLFGYLDNKDGMIAYLNSEIDRLVQEVVGDIDSRLVVKIKEYIMGE